MFIESPSFPDTLAYGGVGGPRWLTLVTSSPTGTERRQPRWTLSRGHWAVTVMHRTSAETLTLLAFFYAIAQGRAHGFRLRDFEGGEDTGTDEPLGTGTGSSATYQLVKRYTLGAQTYSRPITKPISGSLVVKVNGTPTTSFTVNTATGIVTMTATNGATLTASFLFEVPVRFAQDACRIRFVAPNAYTWDAVEMVEIRDIV